MLWGSVAHYRDVYCTFVTRNEDSPRFVIVVFWYLRKEVSWIYFRDEIGNPAMLQHGIVRESLYKQTNLR